MIRMCLFCFAVIHSLLCEKHSTHCPPTSKQSCVQWLHLQTEADMITTVVRVQPQINYTAFKGVQN